VSFLLDTNVVSEWTKPCPNPGVVGWLETVDEDRVYLSVVTLVELRYGIERLAVGKKRKRLEEWLDQELPLRFEERILNIDRRVADACGKLVARREAEGRPIAAMDALLAATAGVHRLTLVTRNESDFQGAASCFSPWTDVG
jgi:predicted nucleic acid-binding protein